MHWTRIRDDLYDAGELARARKKRGLGGYTPKCAPRKKPARTATCATTGCSAPVHYGGAVCSPCRLDGYERSRAKRLADERRRAARRRAEVAA